jgi:hypothetical protein
MGERGETVSIIRRLVEFIMVRYRRRMPHEAWLCTLGSIATIAMQNFRRMITHDYELLITTG